MEWRGQFCKEGSPSARVIRTGGEWAGLWKKSLGNSAPAVDFARFFAVAVFAGTRMTGGTEVDILPPVSEKEELRVPYKIRSARADSFTIQVLTQPYAVRLMPRTDLKILVFEIP